MASLLTVEAEQAFYLLISVIILGIPISCPGTCLSKVPECFRTWKAVAKSQSLWLQPELFYSRILNMNKGSLYARGFRHIRLSAFRYRLIKNAFAGPKSFWDFAVMGPLNTMYFPLFYTQKEFSLTWLCKILSCNATFCSSETVNVGCHYLFY